jgi:outer membrane protein assembly factor BamB
MACTSLLCLAMRTVRKFLAAIKAFMDWRRLMIMANIRTRRFSLVAAILVLVALLVPTGWVVRSVAASSASLTLSPAAGQAGTSVQVSGGGFGHKESVNVTFDATLVATATAANDGSFSTSFVVPQTAQPGNHTVIGTGQRSRRSASTTFQVVSPVGTNWTQFGFAEVGGRANSAENTITTGNVAQLTQDWSASLNGSIPAVTVYGTTVYADDGTGIDALDAASGKLLWFSSTMGGGSTVSSYVSPAVGNGMVYASGGGHVYGFDAQTGVTRWTFNTQSYSLSSPTVANGIVYIAQRGGSVYALDGTSGTALWTFQVGVGDGVDQTPAVANGTVYFVSLDGIAYALNASTGAQVWQTAVGSPGEGVNVPAVDNGTVFVVSGAPYPSTQGEVVALDATTGATKWTAYTPFYGTSGLALANGTIYVSTISNGVYAFDEANGALKWQVSVAMSDSAPAVANGVVYVGAGTAYVYAFDAATGATLATVGNCGIQPDSSPTVANGVVYIGCASTLRAFHLPGTTP